ncbi:MAG TPA: hypothetical protein VNA12_07765 [Mycobacteriales bacterium]|nr:hypothetical protein [Mycobacteriales bacterium]
MYRRRPVIAALLGLTVLGASSSAYAAAGTGTVVDTLTATVTTGGLTLAGAGANVALNAVPGSFTEAAGATVLTMTDTTGTSNGWRVTASYTAPSAGNDLGGANVKVTSFNAVPDTALAPLLGTGGLNPVTDQALTSPVSVLSTEAATGLGVSTAQVKYKVKVPITATVGQVYGGTVTYTIASIR